MFPKYYVLTQLFKNAKVTSPLNDYYIISVQHLLESTGSLFESLINLGFLPENIFLTGKIYSTHNETKDKLKRLGINILESTFPKVLGYYAETLQSDIIKMWNLLGKKLKTTSKIIILDDGGYTLKNTPVWILKHYVVFGIEQTTSGIRFQQAFDKFPIINVAASAAKTILEPPIVSEAVKIHLGNIIKQIHPKSIGVAGYGHIGKAVVKDLKKLYNILIYDPKNDITNIKGQVTFCKTLDELYDLSDIVIGATGSDISNLGWLTNGIGEKTLISVSSGDIEFNKLLRHAEKYIEDKILSPLQVLNLKIKNGYRIRILRGGMVANFTGESDSGPGLSIQITRGLLFSAILQIIRDKKILKKGSVMLDPLLQLNAVKFWFEDQPKRQQDYPSSVLDGFKCKEWVIKNSEGLFLSKNE